MRAFALMRDPKDLEATFRSSPLYVRNQVAIEALRSALPAGLAMHYWGIGRFPFTEYPERGPGWQGEGPDDDDEAQARRLLGRRQFSILCDAALWPTGHPATSEAIPELSRHLRLLNQHALFSTVDAAEDYTAWYIGQNWAEGSPESFVVVAVGAATGDAG
jgi:hypothetical protein